MQKSLLLTLLSAGTLAAQTPSPSPTAAASPQPEASPASTASPSPATSGTASQAPASAVPQVDMVDALAEAEVKEAIEQIKSLYVDPQSVTPEKLDRALLTGLIHRLPTGVSVLSGSAAAEATANAAFVSEVLDNRIGYVRLGSIDQPHVADFDKALDEFTRQGLKAMILDLRATPVTSDFDAAAEVTRRFTPKGRPLFSLKGRTGKADRVFTSNQDPRFTGVVVVVVNSENAGASEVIAQTLRQHAGAMIVGQRSAGKPAEFADIPLRSGAILRVAVAEITVQDAPSIYPEGVKPDLTVQVPLAAQKEAMREAATKGVASLVFEVERPRFNEAALVAGTNPEIDALQAAQREKGKERPKIIRDTLLQRAVDVITSVEIYKAAGSKPAKAE